MYPSHNLLRRYAVAVASVGLALGAALLLRYYHLPHPFPSFSLVAIAISFWFGGTGPGLVTLILSCLAMGHFFVPLRGSALSRESYFIIYGVFSACISWFSASRHRAERLLTQAHDTLELRVAQRTEELTRANQELQGTQRELAGEKDRLRVLLNLTNSLVSTLDIRDALKTVLGNLREVTASDFVGVGLPSADHDELHSYALDFVVEGDVRDGEAVSAEESLPVRVFRAGTLWTGSMQDLPARDRGDSFLANQLKTVCAIPLLSRDRALGILVLGRRAEAPYMKSSVAFMEQVSRQIAIAVDNALWYQQASELTEKLAQEKLYLEDEIRSDANFREIIGTSAALHRILNLVETVAPTASTVLISGETGTGKELIARAIHNLSPRRDKTFVKLNCAAIPTGLVESELFGHERGAFTGAIAQRVGRLELANKGTLFLDEISEIPMDVQAKLLRALQEREFERLGSPRTLRTDVRLIVATNRDLSAMVEAHTFRADLFFRLNVFPITVPPLRKRAEDIPLLVRHFAEEFSRRINKTIETIPSETMKALCRYSWPGNIRELQNVIERAVILSPGPSLKVRLAELQPRGNPEPADPKSNDWRSSRRRAVRSIVTEVDRTQIIRALREADGRVGGPGGAADRLGLKRTTLITRMKKLGIDSRSVSEDGIIDTDTSDTSNSVIS